MRFVVMACTMLFFGGGSLIDGLSRWREPTVDTAAMLENLARASGQSEAMAQVHAAGAEIASRHRQALRVDVLLTLGTALLTLYAAAAIFLGDLQARRLAVATGVAGLAVHFARLPLAIHAARQLAGLGAPVLQQFMVQNGKQAPGMSPADMAIALHATVVMIPLFQAGVGCLWPLALLLFFGSRRGRDLAGTARPPTAQG
ncbi:MAG TPA: hypothetical protein VLC06_04900 [Polyangia bacterium]|nr:hypothetical protein [Polyangia bacterium]